MRRISAIVRTTSDDEFSEDYIVPSVFNRRVADAVAAAAEAAVASGVARRPSPPVKPAVGESAWQPIA